MSELAKIDNAPMVRLTPQTVKELTARPLLAVPPELRAAVFQTWAVYRHLAGFDTPAAVAFAVSVWVNAHGYDPAKVANALAAVTRPDVMRKVKFASDFTATLAELVHPPETEREAWLRKAREMHEERERVRKEAAEWSAANGRP